MKNTQHLKIWNFLLKLGACLILKRGMLGMMIQQIKKKKKMTNILLNIWNA